MEQEQIANGRGDYWQTRYSAAALHAALSSGKGMLLARLWKAATLQVRKGSTFAELVQGETTRILPISVSAEPRFCQSAGKIFYKGPGAKSRAPLISADFYLRAALPLISRR